MLPLEGMIVAEFTNWIPGPYCTRLLNDMGARVIKVEPTISGDPLRKSPETFGVVNAGKESIALNLLTSEGQEIAHRFLCKVDIVIEGYRPGTTARMGIDYTTVRRLKEDVIYCSITGFGQTGPLAQQPVHNISVLAETGILGLWRDTSGRPVAMQGVPVADLSATMFALASILGAVVQKAKNGKGAYIDVSMGDSCISWISGLLGRYQNESQIINDDLYNPVNSVFKAKDEKYLVIAANADKHWLSLCKALEFNDYINDPSLSTIYGRRKMANEIISRIAEKIYTRERAYWLDILKSHDIAANSVNTLEELSDHPHFLQTHLINPATKPSFAEGIAFPAIVNNERWGNKRSSAPVLGQNTLKLLKSLGYSKGEIESLAKNGVISL